MPTEHGIGMSTPLEAQIFYSDLRVVMSTYRQAPKTILSLLRQKPLGGSPRMLAANTLEAFLARQAN